MKKLLFAILALLAIPAHAQVTQSAQINSNTLNTTANIVTLDTGATALSLGVSTTGTLSCGTYPVITFIDTRNAVNTTLAVIATSNAASWTASPLFTALLPGDLIFAKLTTSGIGCTNELPLTVSATYSPQAGLCDANPSACVTLTGTIAATNGLPASNMTLTFQPSQQAFLGGVPPTPSGGGGGYTGGICEALGANPGGICYFNGSGWTILGGNNSGTATLEETFAGVPFWQVASSSPVTSISGDSLLITNNDSTGAVTLTVGTAPLHKFWNGSWTRPTCADLSDSGPGCSAASVLPSGTGVVRVNSGTGSAAEISGDATTSGSNALTLAMVNSNVGTFTNPTITVNAKGLVTAAANGSGGGITTIDVPAGLLTPATCTGPTCNFTAANSAPGTILRAQPGGSFLPITQRGQPTTYFNVSGGNSWTITLAQPASGPDLLDVGIIVNDNSGQGCAVGDNASPSSLTVTDNLSNSYPLIDSYSPVGNGYTGHYYGKNIAGATSLTVTANGVTNACIAAWVTDLFNVDTSAPLDRHALSFSGSSFTSVTTTAANEIVLGEAFIINAQNPYSGSSGWGFYVPSTATGVGNVTVATIGQLETGIGTYTPQIIFGGGSGGAGNATYTVSYKAASSGGGSAPWFFGTPDFPLIMWNVFPNLANISPAVAALGDTGIDLHVGTPIEATGVTSAYPGNNTASKLAVVASGSPAAYHCWVNVTCHTSVSTATVIPSLLYTDTSNTAETIQGSTATCTTLGTNSVSFNQWPIYAYQGTSIYLETTLANSPHYDVSAVCSLANTQ